MKLKLKCSSVLNGWKYKNIIFISQKKLCNLSVYAIYSPYTNVFILHTAVYEHVKHYTENTDMTWPNCLHDWIWTYMQKYPLSIPFALSKQNEKIPQFMFLWYNSWIPHLDIMIIQFTLIIYYFLVLSSTKKADVIQVYKFYNHRFNSELKFKLKMASRKVKSI